ncbi:MAG: zinc protease [Alphaproteobacteria bacterium BRH_c36]|nr:MAG: zinc protease [Alphaproteobacteria bacterium BRH_c36]
MRKTGIRRFPHVVATLLLSLMITATQTHSAAFAEDSKARASSFTLDNGLEVIVVPDTRAPVVTHMVWYRVGAADEPKGASGIAHFLEHLMFKSTEKIAIGEFSKIVARMGGQDNAFTSQDATAYFQRIAKDRLADVMAMEADRMVNLRLTEKEVLTERDVILEERRSRTDNNPGAILTEQMDAALYYSHPYGTPVIGWSHEIASLDQHDAIDFYKLFYAPNNAILVVAGDVTVDEVRRLAQETYGKIPANNKMKLKRERPQEPPHLVARRLTLNDPRAGKASMHRFYLAPSYVTAAKGEAEALDVMMKILASGSTSRFYKKLVVEKQLASSAGGWYYGDGYDSGKVSMYAVAADGVGLPEIEAEIDGLIADIARDGVTEAELKRAKSSLTAEYIYGIDSQSTMARRYGWAAVVGQSASDVESWPDDINAVSAEQVKAAAAKTLQLTRSVTGYLVPEAAVPTAQRAHDMKPADKG